MRLLTDKGNREAVGATVIARFAGHGQAQVMTRGSGYGSCQPPELIFGLGDAPAAELVVRWPFGGEERFGSVPAGSRVILRQGQGKPEPFAARPAPLPDPWPEGLRIAVGEKIPPFTLEGADGARLAYDPAKIPAGQVLHINLWASYCRPCREELPQLEALHRKDGHQVLGVSLDGGPGRAEAQDLLRKAGVTFPNAFLIVDDDQANLQVDQFLDLFRLVLPTTLEVDSTGTLTGVYQGRLRPEEPR
ncbi:MAG: ASPIC/UnbV domain-containing protein [Planctomycetota bacterium]